MARSLTSPLFSDEDFDKVEQSIREERALKARHTAVNIPPPNPAAELRSDPSSVSDDSRAPAPLTTDEPLLGVHEMLSKILNEENAHNKPTEITDVGTSEPIATHIPEFLKRDFQQLADIEIEKADVKSTERGTNTISWKLPYAILGTTITSVSIYLSAGYSTLLAIVTLIPLVDPKFYRKRDQ